MVAEVRSLVDLDLATAELLETEVFFGNDDDDDDGGSVVNAAALLRLREEEVADVVDSTGVDATEEYVEDLDSLRFDEVGVVVADGGVRLGFLLALRVNARVSKVEVGVVSEVEDEDFRRAFAFPRFLDEGVGVSAVVTVVANEEAVDSEEAEVDLVFRASCCCFRALFGVVAVDLDFPAFPFECVCFETVKD